METTLIFLAVCLVSGSVAALFSFQPDWLPTIEHANDDDPALRADMAETVALRRFTLQNALIIVGPDANHRACRLQRRLLKSAVPFLIREDVTIVEIYGATSPRRNGEIMSWLDSSLLRHALEAETGFALIYVDASGRTAFRRASPTLADTIIDLMGLPITLPRKPQHRDPSPELQHLQAV